MTEEVLTVEESKEQLQEFVTNVRNMLKSAQSMMEAKLAESTIRNGVLSSLVGSMDQEDANDFMDLLFDDEADVDEIYEFRERLNAKYKEK